MNLITRLTIIISIAAMILLTSFMVQPTANNQGLFSKDAGVFISIQLMNENATSTEF